MAKGDDRKPDAAAERRRARLAAELRRNLQLRKAQGRARRAGEPDLGEGLPAARDNSGSEGGASNSAKKPSQP